MVLTTLSAGAAFVVLMLSWPPLAVAHRFIGETYKNHRGEVFKALDIVDFEQFYYYHSIHGKMAESLSVSQCTIGGGIKDWDGYSPTGGHDADIEVNMHPPGEIVFNQWRSLKYALSETPTKHATQRQFVQVSPSLCISKEFKYYSNGNFKRAKGCLKMVTKDKNTGRETKVVNTYGATLHPDHARCNHEAAVKVLRPTFPSDEIEEAKEVAKLMVDEMPSDLLSRDAAQMAAYPGYPMGNAHFCPMEGIDSITPEMVREFHKENFVASNCYVTAAGVDHDQFVRLVQQKFGDINTSSDSRKDIQQRRGKSKYQGGMVVSERGLKEPYIKVAVGFEVGGWDDADVIPYCVLNQLLGGGSSFSAGGPGKGMYTRLYTQVLNQYSFTESMEAFIALHEDDGLMGIDAACPPEYVPHIIRIIIDQLVKLAVEPVSDEELSRARNMCKSMLLMQLESRVVVCEDIARQYVTYGKRHSPVETCALIDAVTADDLMRVADAMLSFPPSIGVVGPDVSKVPKYEDIADFAKMYVEEGRKIREKKKAGN